MTHWSIEIFSKACFRYFFEAKQCRPLFLPLLVLLGGCEQLRVQNLPNSKLFCDANLVGVWKLDASAKSSDQQEPNEIEEDETASYAFLKDKCSGLYMLDVSASSGEAASVDVLDAGIRSFTLNRQTFMVAPREPKRDTSDAFENGYFLLRYEVQSDTLLIAPGDVYSAAKDIDASKVSGTVFRRKNSDNSDNSAGSGIDALLTGTGEKIAQQLQKHNYYTKLGEPTLHRANAIDSARVMQAVSKFQNTQKSKK